MSREKHYLSLGESGGPRYRTFQEYCEGELRKTKSHVYALIRAHEILREYGCEALPIDPFTVRSLSRLKDEGQIVTCWERACSQKNAGRLPSKSDIDREVRPLLPVEPTRESRRAADKYSTLLTKSSKSLKEAMEDLDFRTFLKSKNRASQEQKEELAEKLKHLIHRAVLHHMMITGHIPKARRIIVPKSIELVTGKKRQAVRYKF